MKKLSLFVPLAGLLLLSGCASLNMSPTPAYTEAERDRIVAYNWTLEWQELADDTDHALLLRPGTNLTKWNVYHSE